jgi:hypothetical protein
MLKTLLGSILFKLFCIAFSSWALTNWFLLICSYCDEDTY